MPSRDKKFRRYDMLDEADFEIETLSEMKKWLIDFWNWNPSESMTKEEHEDMIEGIMQSDESELLNRLAGIGYSFESQ